MSYDGEMMQALKYAIRDEIPPLTNQLRKINENFGDKKLINALNESVKAQQNSNLLRLCEISMQRPDLNLLTSDETIAILKLVKESIVVSEQKEEPKKKGFFR